MVRFFGRTAGNVTIQGTRILMALTAVMLFFGCAPGRLGAEILTIPGTGACETVLRRLAEAFTARNPELVVEVPPSTGSGGGIRAVLEKEAVLARVARTLEEDEKAAGLEYKPFARDAVVFAVGSDVTVRDLGSAQLADIFSGKVLNWKDAGGKDAPIRVLTREPDDSSLAVIRRHIPSFRNLRFSPFGKSLYHDYEMVETLARYHNSVGWLTASSLWPVRQTVHAVSLAGIAPTPENILAGRYALVEQYGIVYKKGNLTPSAQAFLRFLLSEPCRALMREYGLAPFNESGSNEDH